MCSLCPVSGAHGSAGLWLLCPWVWGCQAQWGGGCLKDQQDGPCLCECMGEEEVWLPVGAVDLAAGAPAPHWSWMRGLFGQEGRSAAQEANVG